jgi:hypothetical protein
MRPLTTATRQLLLLLLLLLLYLGTSQPRQPMCSDPSYDAARAAPIVAGTTGQGRPDVAAAAAGAYLCK